MSSTPLRAKSFPETPGRRRRRAMETTATGATRSARAHPHRRAATATPGEIFMRACDSENRVCAGVKHKCHTLEMKEKLFRFAALSTIYIRYGERARATARAGSRRPSDPTEHPTRINKIYLFIYGARGRPERGSIKCRSQNMYRER